MATTPSARIATPLALPARNRSQVYAALDLGTSNCRLLIARPAQGGFEVIGSFARIVRLGQGLAASGRLSEAAIARTITALKLCAAKMRRSCVTRRRVVATEACRRAANSAQFLERVEAEAGLAVEVISRDEEAALAVRGSAPLFDPSARRALVFDIGGGSTELMWVSLEGAQAPRLLGWTSLDCGVVTLAERHGSDRFTAGDFAAMVDEVELLIAPFEAAHGLKPKLAAGDVQLLGTSGTVTTLAAIHLGLKRYDRAKVDGVWIDFDEAERVSRRLAGMSCAERVALPTVGKGRADLVVAGCAVLAAIMGLWPVGRLRVADRGIREGILLGLVAADEGAALPGSTSH